MEMINIDEFIKQMTIFFPEIEEEIKDRMKETFEGLDTIVIEEIVMPKVTELIKRNVETVRLREIFEYFENVCTNSDEYLLNVFSITALEILGNEIAILKIAKEYMGPITKKLQWEADIDLGRIVEHHK